MSCSKRKWRYVFLGCGMFFLLTGVISGVLIPKLVVSVVEKMLCVDSVDDSDYKDWAKEKPGLVTKLYYWQIKNQEGFLYDGEVPELQEKGPYVYKQNTQNIDVTFKDNRRSFKSWQKKAVFSKEDSCANCSEDDKLTVLNTGYLATMESFGGDLNFALLNLPVTVKILLSHFNISYKQLGNLNGSMWSNKSLSGWTNPEFGAWFQQTYPNQVNGNFTVIEMKGLYSVLGNSETLFGLTLTNDTVKHGCLNKPINPSCGFLAHLRALLTYPNNSTLIRMSQAVLCTNATESCFNRTEVYPMIFHYILHVSKYTMWYMLHEQDDIVTTISQKKLALGYKMKSVRNPKNPEQNVEVPGMLVVDDTEEDAINNRYQQSFYTCSASQEKRHQWTAYRGKNTIPSTLFNLSTQDQAIAGYLSVVPHSKTADKPCSFSQELPMKSFDVFVSALYTKFKLSYREEASLYGLELKRFTVSKTDYLNHSAVTHGVIDFSKLRGFAVVGSLPHYLHSDLKIEASFDQQPDEQKHQSVYDVEPVTGLVVRALLRFQTSFPIKNEFVQVERIRPLNITYKASKTEELLKKGIPFLWAEYGAQATKSDVSEIDKKVVGILGLSCGLLIALPVVGGIFIVVFVSLFVLSVKGNEVTHVA